MIIDTPVHVALEENSAAPQPIAVECPTCFAIVRKARLDRHVEALHGDEAGE